MKNLIITLLVIVIAILLFNSKAQTNKQKNELNNNSNSISVNSEIDEIAEKLAKASLKRDTDLMTTLGNELMSKNAIPKEIRLGVDCHEVIYSYQNNEYSKKACK